MLVLAFKKGGTVRIGESEVTILGFSGQKVKVRIETAEPVTTQQREPTLRYQESFQLGALITLINLGVDARQVRLGIDAPPNVAVHRHPRTYFCHEEVLIFFPTTRNDVKLGACLMCRAVYIVTDYRRDEIQAVTYDELCPVWQVDPKEVDRAKIKTTINPDRIRLRRKWSELPLKVREALNKFRK